MATIPPEQPPGGPEAPSTAAPGPSMGAGATGTATDRPYGGGYGGGYGGISRGPTTGAILPVPGNAELAIYLLAVIFLAVIWAASDQLEAHGFSWIFGMVTVAYLISRGLAKATRVLEQ